MTKFSTTTIWDIKYNTCIPFSIERHLLRVFRLLHGLSRHRASAERSMRQKGTVDVSCTVATRRRTIDAFKFHRGGRGYRSFVLFDGAAAFQNAHLVAIGDGTTRGADDCKKIKMNAKYEQYDKLAFLETQHQSLERFCRVNFFFWRLFWG